VGFAAIEGLGRSRRDGIRPRYGRRAWRERSGGASPAGRAGRASGARVWGVGDDPARKEAQALEEGGDHRPSSASGSHDERGQGP